MKYFAALLGLFVVIAANSQNKYKVTAGPEQEARRTAVKEVVGEYQGNVIIIRTQKKNVFLEVIDHNAQTKKSLDMSDLTYGKYPKVLYSAFIIEDRLYLRFAVNDRNDKKYIGIVEEYDPITLQFRQKISEESTSIENLKRVYWYGFGVDRAISELNENGTYVSNNKTHVLDYFSSFDGKKSDFEQISLRVYDKELNVKWEGDFELPYTSALFNIRKVVVDENGNAHMLGLEYKDKVRTMRKGKPNYTFHVLSFLNDGTLIKDNTVELPDEFVTDATIGITANGKVVATGFYGSRNLFSIDGIFSVLIDVETKQIIASNKQEFEKEFIQMGMTDREKKRSDKREGKGEDLEMPEFDLDRLVLLEDGGWLLVAEQFYITQTTFTTTNPNGSITTRNVINYHYDDIIAVRMDAQGKIQWCSKIPKSQSTSGFTEVLSYAFGYCDGSFLFVYNNGRNLKKSSIFVAEISAEGKVEYDNLISSEKDDLFLYPRYSNKIDNCSMLLYEARGNKYAFSILKKK